MSRGALCSSRSKDSGDISATYRVNEDDNDERGGDDLEGGTPGEDINEDEGDGGGCLPVQNRCSGAVAPPSPALPLTMPNEPGVRRRPALRGRCGC